MKLTLVTPEKRVLLSQEVTEVTIPAFKGELNVLPGHQPLVTTLVPGIIRYKMGTGSETRASISWGYCNISPEGVNVLAESVELPSEVDFNSVVKDIEAAEQRLAKETMDDETWRHVEESLAHAKARLALEKYTQS
jgi:F-type H+-transporting ATPase subunit epsilon